MNWIDIKNELPKKEGSKYLICRIYDGYELYDVCGWDGKKNQFYYLEAEWEGHPAKKIQFWCEITPANRSAYGLD